MRILVVHQGKRDGYEVTAAFAEAGHDVRLVTSGYGRGIVSEVSRLFSRYCPRKIQKLAARRHASLDSVIVDYANLTEIFLQMMQGIFGERFSQELIEKDISRRAIKVLNAGDFDAVICYNYHGFRVLRHAEKNRSALKVLFQCHPHPHEVRRVFGRLIAAGKMPVSNVEREYYYSDGYVGMLSSEVMYADFVLCASSYTKNSVHSTGFPIEKIDVVPYGVDCNEFNYSDLSECPGGGVLKLLYVGQFTHRKGFYDLVDILNKLSVPVEMIFVGRGGCEVAPTSLIDNNFVRASVLWDISQEKLCQEFLKADIFLFPSALEGFGQVLLEAMASGCVVMASTHTAAPDLIVDGVNGYFYPSGEVNKYAQDIERLNRDRFKLKEMKKMARLSAERNTWKKFRNSVVEAVENKIVARAAIEPSLLNSIASKA